jgi:hypothetical protein
MSAVDPTALMTLLPPVLMTSNSVVLLRAIVNISRSRIKCMSFPEPWRLLDRPRIDPVQEITRTNDVKLTCSIVAFLSRLTGGNEVSASRDFSVVGLDGLEYFA